MGILHVREVKEAVGNKAIEVLTDIFRSAKGTPPMVGIPRYRADHPEWLDIIDGLEVPTLFLERDRDHENYFVRVYGLPLVEDDKANELLDHMEKIFQFFKKVYKERLTEPLTFKEIVEALSLDPNDASEALFYMTQSHAVLGGRNNDFPKADDSKTYLTEQVLRYDSFGDILSQFYEWHIINPQNSAEGLEAQLNSEQIPSGGFFNPSDFSHHPNWIEELDNTNKALIVEIDKAIKMDLSALPTIGLRTLLERTILDHIQDQGNFNKNLKKFKNAGYITEQHSNLLDGVIGAGNASAHRAYFPNNEDLVTCIEIVKHLLHGVYVLKPKAEKVSQNTPERPSFDNVSVEKIT